MSRMAVIGAGPSGIAASIQLARTGHEVTVFEPRRVGGNLWNAGFVENYPGFPGGITGRHLAELMEEHFYEHCFVLRPVPVNRIENTGTGFLVVSDREESFRGVILCTGTRPKKAGFPGEDRLHEAGLLHYGIADMKDWFEEGDALVVGGGESSMDMALTLMERGLKVTLLHRSKLRGVRYLLDAIKAEERIITLQGEIEEVRMHGRKAVARVGGEEMAFDMMLLAVGREPHLPELVGIDLDYPPAGFKMAGDAKHGGLGQSAMAVGDGVRVAMEANREVRE